MLKDLTLFRAQRTSLLLYVIAPALSITHSPTKDMARIRPLVMLYAISTVSVIQVEELSPVFVLSMGISA